MTSHRRTILAALAMVLGVGIVVAVANGESFPTTSKPTAVSGATIPAPSPPAATAGSPVQGATPPAAPGESDPADSPEASAGTATATPPQSVPVPALPAFPPLPPLPTGAVEIPCPPGLMQGGTCVLPFPLPPPPPHT